MQREAPIELRTCGDPRMGTRVQARVGMELRPGYQGGLGLQNRFQWLLCMRLPSPYSAFSERISLVSNHIVVHDSRLTEQHSDIISRRSLRRDLNAKVNPAANMLILTVTILKGHQADKKKMIILANCLYHQSDRDESTAAIVRLKTQPSDPRVLSSLRIRSPNSRICPR